MLSHARLLGFAFANADFLFEVDADGMIQFAVGATRDLVRESGEDLVGKPLDCLFLPAEAEKFTRSVKRLRSGCRAGPSPFWLRGTSTFLCAIGDGP